MWTRAREYVSGHHRNQVRFWGVAPSYSFIEQPHSNGVAGPRAAVAAFVELYNGIVAAREERRPQFGGEARSVVPSKGRRVRKIRVQRFGRGSAELDVWQGRHPETAFCGWLAPSALPVGASIGVILGRGCHR